MDSTILRLNTNFDSLPAPRWAPIVTLGRGFLAGLARRLTYNTLRSLGHNTVDVGSGLIRPPRGGRRVLADTQYGGCVLKILAVVLDEDSIN